MRLKLGEVAYETQTRGAHPDGARGALWAEVGIGVGGQAPGDDLGEVRVGDQVGTDVASQGNAARLTENQATQAAETPQGDAVTVGRLFH
jgi:hypothetical protein